MACAMGTSLLERRAMEPLGRSNNCSWATLRATLVFCTRYDFDDFEAAVLVHKSKKISSAKALVRGPTLLEREALSLSGSIPWDTRMQASNRLLELLEKKGVPPGYAFELVRHGAGLIGKLAEDDGSLSDSKVTAMAENPSFPRLVIYFHRLHMKASDVPKVLPFVESGIEAVMAKVEFLRSIGVKADSLASVLAAWPGLLLYQCDELAHVVEYLTSIGFNSKDIGRLVMKTPRVLSQSSGELVKRVQFMQAIGMSVKDMRKLVGRYPSLLSDELDTRLSSLVSHLEREGVSLINTGRIIARRPVLLESDFQKDLAPTIAYLKSINASSSDIGKILSLFPGLFGYDPEEDIRPVVTYLESLGVPPGLMGRLFRRHPQLLKNRFHIQQRIEYLLSLGVDSKDLGQVLFKAPQLMSLSVEENMVPTVRFLANVGINVVKVLKSKPMVLGYSVEAKLQPNLNFLEKLGVSPNDIGKLVSRNPHLLTLSVEKNLHPTVSYLLELGFESSEIALMVKKLPSLLGFSVATLLLPKYEFLVCIMKRSPKELVQFPHYFSYSLARRLVPRFERLGEHFQDHCLGSIYSCSDASFEKRIKRWTSTPKTNASVGGAWEQAESVAEC